MSRPKLLALIGIALLVITRLDILLPGIITALQWLACCEALFAMVLLLGIWRSLWRRAATW